MEILVKLTKKTLSSLWGIGKSLSELHPFYRIDRKTQGSPVIFYRVDCKTQGIPVILVVKTFAVQFECGFGHRALTVCCPFWMKNAAHGKVCKCKISSTIPTNVVVVYYILRTPPKKFSFVACFSAARDGPKL